MNKDMNKIALMGAGFFGNALHTLEKDVKRTINEPTPFVISDPHKPTGVDHEIYQYPTAKKRRASSDRRPVTPPRSMTPEELAYYKIHKTLKGFANGHTKL